MVLWKRGRVVEGTGLENQRRATVREFESHRFRQLHQLIHWMQKVLGLVQASCTPR